jgi:glycerol uptake facilitator-like aquaporin
MTHFKK